MRQFAWTGVQTAGVGLVFLERQLGLNITRVPDPSHDVTNDVALAISRVGMKPHSILMQACWNMLHGPWGQDTIFQQGREAMEEVWENASPSEEPLWQRFAARIMSDIGWADRIGDENIEEDLWRHCQENSPWRKKTCKMSSSRFMGYTSKSIAERPFWHQRLWAYTHIALELDWLKGKAFQRMVLPREEALHDGEVPRLAAPAADEKLLRQSCQNALVLAILFMDNADNLAKQNILTHVASSWLPWHQEQNRRLRQCGEAETWLREQSTGAFLRACKLCWATLNRSLHECGLEVNFTSFARNGAPDVESPQVVRQDEFAGLLGRMITELLSARLRRCLWFLRGWPALFCLLPGGGLQMLRSDWRNYQSLQERGCAPEILERSVFRTKSVMQVVLLLDATQWQVSPELEQLLRRRGKRLQATQLIEDGFKRQRKSEKEQSNRVGAARRAFSVLVEKHLLSIEHQFDELEVSQLLVHTSECVLPEEAFRPQPGEVSLPLSQIISCKQKAWWYSPSSSDEAQVHADLCMLEHVQRRDQWDLLQDRWLTSLLRCGGMLIREADSETQPWYFALGEITNYCAILWLANEGGDEWSLCFPA